VVGGIRDVNAFDGVLVGERVGDELHYRGVVESQAIGQPSVDRRP
jgi:hypothetical protein